MGSELFVAAVLAAVALAAAMLSVEAGLSVAVIEIVAGVVVGNVLHLSTPDWLVFLAGFGSVVLTFLAGTEVDPGELRQTWRVSLLIGGLSFAVPFVAAMLLCRYGFGWTWPAAQIGGIALSTTSLAVAYAVLVETGLSRTPIGKLIMSATFVTDMGTVIALSALFLSPTWWLVPFVAVAVVLTVVMPRLDRWFFARHGDRVIEPEIKGAFAALLVLMWLGDQAHSHAVLPAFVLGLAVSRTLARHRPTQQRFRVVAFALLTPFFFLRSGLNVSLPLVIANLGLLGILLALKAHAEVGCRLSAGAPVRPTARRVHHFADEHRPDVRHDLGHIRLHRRPDQPGTVLHPGHSRRALRGHTDRHRTTLPNTRRWRQQSLGDGAHRPPRKGANRTR